VSDHILGSNARIFFRSQTTAPHDWTRPANRVDFVPEERADLITTKRSKMRRATWASNLISIEFEAGNGLLNRSARNLIDQ